jgi:integrase
MAYIYKRTRGKSGTPRFYADLTSEGGGREPLVPRGETLATSDDRVAAVLFAQRLRELRGAKVDKAVLGVARRATIGEWAAEHIRRRRGSKRVTERWLAEMEMRLQVACEYFEPDTQLLALDVDVVQQYADWLRTFSNGRGGTLSLETQGKYRDALSNMFEGARRARLYTGENPVELLEPLESPEPAEAFLEAWEVALLLEHARQFRSTSPGRHAPFYAYALLAFVALTGVHESEATGLELRDVSFEAGRITIRQNDWRRLKNKYRRRSVPLWPQLRETLLGYVNEHGHRLNRLLFPSERLAEKGVEGMITDSRKMLDAIGARAGWKPGEIRWKVFRHSYCSARLQTLDAGHPVALFTVARELGHQGTAMVERVYSHLGDLRHRAEAVEYRIDQHRDQIDPARLRHLSAA